MSDIGLAVGTIVYVSDDIPATYDKAGFEAVGMVWTEIGEVESVGDFGGSATVTTFTPLKTGIVKKRKGSIDYGTAALAIGRLVGDAGQVLMKSAFDGALRDNVMSFKVEDDEEIAYFTGVVSSYTTVRNDANEVVMINSNIELDNKVISDDSEFFTVVYAAGANGSIIGNTNQRVANGNDASAVYASPAAGYQFDQWSDASTDNPRQDTNVTANISLTATFVVL